MTLFTVVLPNTECYLIRASHAMQVYSSNNGYTANAFLAGDTEPAMKGTDAQELHARAIKTTIHLAIMLVTQMVITAAMSRGKMQYPSKHMDWKKPMLPPSSTTLQVRTIAPADNVAKTNENTLPGFCEPADRQIANVSVNTMGPHKSQLRSAALC